MIGKGIATGRRGAPKAPSKCRADGAKGDDQAFQQSRDEAVPVVRTGEEHIVTMNRERAYAPQRTGEGEHDGGPIVSAEHHHDAEASEVAIMEIFPRVRERDQRES